MEERFITKIAATKEEKEAAYHLRYNDMVLYYDSNNTNKTGLDKNEYDDYADQIIIWDTLNNEVVGCYRAVLSSSLNGKPFICEEEFNIDKLKEEGELICELSRAVIKTEYRGGALLMPLWKFIFNYMLEHKVRYIIGDVSFNGTDREKYIKQISYLANNYGIDDSLNIVSKDTLEPLKIIPNEEMDLMEVKASLPPLFKAYISFGSLFSKQCFVDREFGSVDMFTICDSQHYNKRYIDRILK